jgi:hypothetical protein
MRKHLEAEAGLLRRRSARQLPLDRVLLDNRRAPTESWFRDLGEFSGIIPDDSPRS